MEPNSVALKVLKSHEVARIRFSYPSRSGFSLINRHTFERIYRWVDEGRITVAVAPKEIANPKALAEYNPRANKISLRNPPHGRRIRATLLHECVHGYFDIKSRGAPLATDEEAVAYVVESLYRRMTNESASHQTSSWAIAGKLLDAYQRGTSEHAPVVDLDEWRALERGVRASYSGPAGTAGETYFHNR